MTGFEGGSDASRPRGGQASSDGESEPAASEVVRPSVDLARRALGLALAAERTPRRRPGLPFRYRAREHDDRDPHLAVSILRQMVAEQGWLISVAGGGVFDAWPRIAPEYVGHVAIKRFDPDARCLELVPSSPAYATHLRYLNQEELIGRINEYVGAGTVRALRVLPVGAVGASSRRPPAADPAREQSPDRAAERPAAEVSPSARPAAQAPSAAGGSWARAVQRARSERASRR